MTSETQKRDADDIKPGQKNPGINVEYTEEEIAKHGKAWANRQQRMNAAKVIAAKAHECGCDPNHGSFRRDIMRITAGYIRLQQEDRLPDVLKALDFQRHVKLEDGRSQGHWVAQVRRAWPEDIKVAIPDFLKTPLELGDGVKLPDGRHYIAPKTYAMQQSPEPQLPAKSSKKEPMTRIVHEKISVLTILTDKAYQADAVGQIISDMFKLAGAENEVQSAFGRDSSVDIKIRHSVHESELSQLIRDYRPKAPWITDAFLRDEDGFGLAPMMSSEEVLLSA